MVVSTLLLLQLHCWLKLFLLLLLVAQELGGSRHLHELLAWGELEQAFVGWLLQGGLGKYVLRLLLQRARHPSALRALTLLRLVQSVALVHLALDENVRALLLGGLSNGGVALGKARREQARLLRLPALACIRVLHGPVCLCPAHSGQHLTVLFLAAG